MRAYDKLKAPDLRELSAPGRYSDGGGLYFVIGKKQERRWAFVYKSRSDRYPNGQPKTHELGLGGAPYGSKPGVSLTEARLKADAVRRLLADGKDPLVEKRAKAVAALPMVMTSSTRTVATTAATPLALEGEKNITFGEYADAYVTSRTKGFKSDVHIKQWRRSIEVQASPIRDMRIRDIQTDDVLSILRPVWEKTPESAKRLQERIEKILNAATVEQYRTGQNPAQWVGHLKETELATRKESDVKNHEALPFADMPAFMIELRNRTSVSARALEWTICTAARTNETIGATWGEIDFNQKLWIVPASKMKKNREHRVPLTDGMIAMLEALKPFTNTAPTACLFQNNGRGLSNMAMAELLKGMRGKGPTVHGMRSAFSDWANETTDHDSKIVDFCLAHINGDKSEAAYRRGDALTKRRAVLLDWDKYLLG